jgi:hypothetical protein
MGFSPDQVGRMTLWQFMVCAEACRRNKEVSKRPGQPMTENRAAQLGIEGF